MRIAIAGAGMSGAYLYRRLVNDGFRDIDLYDVKKNNFCGCRPCAWAYAPTPEVRQLIEKTVGPERFELHHATEMSFDGINIRSDALILDKPALIEKMTEGATVLQGTIDPSKYDRIIDATGVSRAYLPRIENDLIANCVQYRVRSMTSLGFWFRMSSVGYEWCFPLGNDEYHIGFGNLGSDVNNYRPPTSLNGEDLSLKVLCKCHSEVRLTSPFHSQPFVKDGKIVGIGESIGAVSPMASDGNLYAMQCGDMLIESWDDLDRYSEKVLQRYDWMRKERKALDKLRAGRMPSILDAVTLKRHCNMAGIEMRYSHILKLFRHMMKR